MDALRILQKLYDALNASPSAGDSEHTFWELFQEWQSTTRKDALDAADEFLRQLTA
jgi:hypothetical protein